MCEEKVFVSCVKQEAFLKGWLVAKGYYNAVKALNLAVEKHKGVTRKSGEPYVSHPIKVVNDFISRGVEDENIIIAGLLHDIIEDTDMSESKLRELFPSESVDIIVLVTKVKGMSLELYFKKISQNYKAILVKLGDRGHNISTMDSFSDEKIIEYVNETKNHILKLCSILADEHPEYGNIAYSLRYQIESNIALAERLLLKRNNE